MPLAALKREKLKWKKQIVALVISVVLLAAFNGVMSAMDTDDISIASTALQPGWPQPTGVLRCFTFPVLSR
ncbi:MAG: hypothetical protein N2V75_08540 [Methanophagales archaeon]|nr:hypothetical protein [Methanophagales archaeon]